MKEHGSDFENQIDNLYLSVVQMGKLWDISCDNLGEENFVHMELTGHYIKQYEARCHLRPGLHMQWRYPSCAQILQYEQNTINGVDNCKRKSIICIAFLLLWIMKVVK